MGTGRITGTYLQSEDIAAQAVVSGQADIGVGTPYALIQKVKAPIRMWGMSRHPPF